MKINDLFITGYENMKLVPSDTLIIDVKWGGLGDHLFFSHIPQIAKETGKYKKVYISNYSEYKSPLYKPLLWDLHPYIDGYIDLPGWYPEIPDTLPGTNLLDMVMLGYGLDDGKRWHEPFFYYKPVLKKELQDKVIYDPNFITNAGRIGIKQLNKFFKGKKVDFQLSPRNNNLLLKDVPFIQSPTLEEYVSIIYSSESFYCLTSGGATLAAAMNKPANVLYGERVKSKFHHSKMHNYIYIRPDKKRLISKIKARTKQLFMNNKTKIWLHV